jgi:hypothetical protein
VRILKDLRAGVSVSAEYKGVTEAVFGEKDRKFVSAHSKELRSGRSWN